MRINHLYSQLRTVLLLSLLLTLLVSPVTVEAQVAPPDPNQQEGQGVVAFLPAPDQSWLPYTTTYTIESPAVAQALPSASMADREDNALVQAAGTDEITANTIEYVRLSTLAVIYTNTPGWHMSTAQIDRVKAQLTRTEDFVWRNSHLQLDLGLKIEVIDTYKDASEFQGYSANCDWLMPNDYDGDGESVENDLIARGYTRDQFDSVNILWAHGSGLRGSCYGGITWWNWGWPQLGTTQLSGNVLLDREDIWNPIGWTMQQTIRGMFYTIGNAYFDPGRPEFVAGRFGEGWDYQAIQMRAVATDQWRELSPTWGALRSGPDADQDGVIDDKPTVPFDEARLGSSPTASDTDLDGATDLEEAMAGQFRASAPANPDTDGDGVVDGQDFAPLYPIQQYIPFKTQTMGNNPANWDLLVDHIEYASAPLHAPVYANWDPTAFYLMIGTDRITSFIGLHIDANGDGWFHGRDNYYIEVAPVNGNPTASGIINAAKIWDCSTEILADKGYCMWDNDPSYPYAQRITPAEIGRYTRANNGGYLVQMAIPANSKTNFAPAAGRQPGLNIFLGSIDYVWQRWAHVFEESDMVYPTLWAEGKTILVSSSTGGRVDGIPFRDEDILAYNQATAHWSLYFDGSDVGITSDVNALAVLDDGSLLLSLNAPSIVPGVGWVDDSDILRFVPTALGSATSGELSIYVRGADLGLTTNGEDIDGLSMQQPGGALLLSTLGTASVDGVRYNDEDVLRYQAGTGGYVFDTLLLDGSAYQLTDRSEDIGGIWQAGDTLYLTTQGLFAVNGVRGNAADIFACTYQPNGSCDFSLFWDGLSAGFDGEQIDALAIVTLDERSVSAAGLDLTEELEANDTVDDDVEDADDVDQSGTTIYLPLIQQE